MKINQTNPHLNLTNIIGVEQAARKEAQEKAAESAKAQAAEEALRLQKLAEGVKKTEGGGKKSPGGQGRRNARYLPDGTIQSEGSDIPDSPLPPPEGGIDIRA